MAAERCREGFSPEMLPVGAGRWFQGTSRQQRGVRQAASAPSPPGIEGPVELERRMCGNHGDPYIGACWQRAVPNKPKERGRDRWCGEVGGASKSDDLR